MISVMKDMSLCVERPRRSPAGLPNRVNVRCERPGCSRRCSITLRMPDRFPFAFADRLEGVFSMLCERLASEDVEIVDPDGQQNLISDAEIDDGSV